jgi:hypothetical protein
MHVSVAHFTQAVCASVQIEWKRRFLAQIAVLRGGARKHREAVRMRSVECFKSPAPKSHPP